MNLIEESYNRLFPQDDFSYDSAMEYNRRLSKFNANISLHRNRIKVNMNLQWKEIDDEIKIGLIQHLLLKLFKKRNHTENITLYHNFVKQIPLLTEKTEADPHLLQSFKRINENYFGNAMQQPNLKWGQAATRKLAHYNFHDDTVVVSSIFQDAKLEILDFLMYHELLHKHFKFEHNNGRSSYHNKTFRSAERLYPNYKDVEKEITNIIRKKRRKRSFF